MASHQGLSKNGRGSRGAGGEVAPIDVSKWRVLKASPRWGSSREAGDEGAKSDITQMGAHSSVAYGATFPILGKATLAVLFA